MNKKQVIELLETRKRERNLKNSFELSNIAGWIFLTGAIILNIYGNAFNSVVSIHVSILFASFSIAYFLHSTNKEKMVDLEQRITKLEEK